MFIAALFTIARSWKQPKCPSTDEWIKKMWKKIGKKLNKVTTLPTVTRSKNVQTMAENE